MYKLGLRGTALFSLISQQLNGDNGEMINIYTLDIVGSDTVESIY